MNTLFEDYGRWPLVIIASVLLIAFAASFVKPKTSRDWRTLGGFAAFIVALFTEMYGFPLTIYLFSGWLTSRFPGVNFFSHDSGHLLETLFGWRANPHIGPFHIVSIILIFIGFGLLSDAWKVLYQAQREHALAMTGPYARIRHPQYTAFILIMVGFLLQWPTILTLIMFPILTWRYVRLAKKEEEEARLTFGEAWGTYARTTPAWVPQRKPELKSSLFSSR
ncbi:MAG: isoprenylcysteine carboxylmethyltransferase family protein [Patescibacteria group bacterium]